VYLDGGYGVGKTHLLASLWHEAPEPRAYGTFVELTHLVGALGFGRTVEALSGHRLLSIDEFELDDPGDTVLVSTLLGKLVDAGVRVAATSNTLPGSLGEGRFAAQDFLREIQTLAGHFTPVRVEGRTTGTAGSRRRHHRTGRRAVRPHRVDPGRELRRLRGPARAPRSAASVALRGAGGRPDPRRPDRCAARRGPGRRAAPRRAGRPALRPRHPRAGRRRAARRAVPLPSC
jgi:hypothetical protein